MINNTTISHSFRLYPSCSELLTEIGVSDLEEIKDILRTIENNTIMRVGVVTYEYDISKRPLDMESSYRVDKLFVDIDDLILSDDNMIGIMVKDLRKLPLNIKKRVYDRFLDVDLITKYPSDSRKLLLLYDDGLGLRISCTQHCAVDEFPLFLEILDLFDTAYYAEDGGDTVDFNQWLEDQNRDDVLDQELK